MASVTVTVSTIDGATPLNSLQAIDSKDIISMTSSDNLTTGTAVLQVRRWEGRAQGAVEKLEKWVTTQSYATVLAAVNAADAEAGAQLTAEKDASGGYVGLTLLKINFKNVLNTFTSFFTNSNTAARTYTFQDRDGTIADDTDLALKEATANKATDFSVINDTKFPTTDAVEDSFQPIWFVAATGTDTYAATLAGVVPTAYYTGMSIRATFQNANTGAATINVNALGAKAIKKGTDGATALAGAEIVVTKIYTLIYDGTNFQIDL